jgi:hypothetical protein
MDYRIEKIKNQAATWQTLVRILPVITLILAMALYGIVNVPIPFVFYGSWIIFIGTSIIQWVWIIRVITEMTGMFGDMIIMVKDIKTDLHETHIEIKNLDIHRND